jgi:hypothetical protein
MQPASSNPGGGDVYGAFGCQIRADRPIPFERSTVVKDRLQLSLVEQSDLHSMIDRSALSRFHDAEDFPGGPRLSVDRADNAFIVEHPDFLLRFVPSLHKIEYRVSFDRDEQFRFGLMVERVAIPLFLLLTQQSVLGIHGGAVTLDGRGWVFIGPSGVGKSTTARTLLGHGARLLADDLSLIDVARQQILPGCPAVRLWEGEGSVEQAVHDTQLNEQVTKRWFRIGSQHVQSEAAPIGGIIVLDPQPPDRADLPVTFERLRGQAAFAAVMRQVFNFSDPEPSFATQQFRNVKALLAEQRVIRYRYRRSHSGEPTHVEPLLEALYDL